MVSFPESAILDWTEAKTKRISGDVQTFCGKLGLELDCISLEQVGKFLSRTLSITVAFYIL